MGSIETAEVLLENGADVTLKDGNGELPLSMAAMRGLNRLVNLLLQHGAEMDIAAAALLGDQAFFEEYFTSNGRNLYFDKGKMSLLQLLVSRGDHPSIAQFLINQGANVNAQDDWQMTPLMYAATYNHPKVAKLLLDYGAEVNSKAKDCETALHHAINGKSLQVVELLLAHGAGVDAVSNGGTPLCRAAEKGCREIAELLIDQGASLEGGAPGMTPLHRASREDQVSVAELLLNRGSNIDARYGFLGYTPLFFAKSKAMVDLLKSYGAHERMYQWAEMLSMG